MVHVEAVAEGAGRVVDRKPEVAVSEGDQLADVAFAPDIGFTELGAVA